MAIEVMEFVEVARLRGEGLWWIIRHEILPNAMPPLTAEFGLRFCFVFLFIASLSFPSLGIQPPLADWGGMVRENAGAGKSTIGLAVMGYTRQGCRLASGTINLNGVELMDASEEDLRLVRGSKIAYVTQSAAASFPWIPPPCWPVFPSM